MPKTRKYNPKYYLGKDALGRPAWMLRDQPATSEAAHTGSAAHLLEMAGDATEGLIERPLPSRELQFQLENTADWNGLDLSGLDLRGVNLPPDGLHLHNTNFEGSDLRGLKFGGASGTNVNFAGALTEGMALDRRTRLVDITSDGVFDLTGVVVGGTLLKFKDPTRLVGLEDMKPSPQGGWGTSVVVGNANFSDEVLKAGALDAFSGFADSDFSGVLFQPAEHHGFYIRGIRFDHCKFVGAEMINAEISSGHFEHCDFLDANASGWMFDGTTGMYSCSFSAADLSGWQMYEDGAHHEVNFQSVSILDANLSGVDADILDAMCRGGATYDSFTVPQAAKHLGMEADEVAMLVWLGELEGRRNDTLDVATGSRDGEIHIPAWAINPLI